MTIRLDEIEQRTLRAILSVARATTGSHEAQLVLAKLLRKLQSERAKTIEKV